jgi:plastocyanin
VKAMLLTLPALAIVLAGCGGGGGATTESAAPSGSAIQVKETEYSLAPGKITIAKPGTVVFDAVNAGKMGHALAIEGNGVDEETGTIDAGSSAKLTVDLAKAGTYDLYCPIDGHEQLGMKATVVVGGAGGSSGTSTTNGGGGGIPGY